MSILSIQSHVTYGYVGNKAAVYPLQSMGYDVWPIHTVQFSNHTGYGRWQGQIFPAAHIRDLIKGLAELGVTQHCQAILSGYLGNEEIGLCIQEIVCDLRQKNSDLVYLCDPVMGDIGRGVFVKPEVVSFFQSSLKADIITPNHFEAELLTAKNITTIEDAKKAASELHQRGINIIVITSLQVTDLPHDRIHVFLSENHQHFIASAPLYTFDIAPNGTGDLFSALFLGCYLKQKNSIAALQQSLRWMDIVMQSTFQAKSRELKVLAADYRQTSTAAT